mgnify:CR=1 FL=1
MALKITVYRFVRTHTAVLRYSPDTIVQVLKAGKDTLILFDCDFDPTESQVIRSQWNGTSIIDVEGKEIFRFVGIVNIQRKSGFIIVRGIPLLNLN